ncbi:MAG: DNA replication/repair protein RecF [Rhodospirillaceae bacterium]|nr:DNA replication/repair protein RecF [Rhodospirillaceae bacterium]OUT77330.1 MAG: DNA replication/repair protein RecF [Rhodospirillaceae bacterium TMED23]|tara:strand:+ start:4782 stop:5948 length:1167 start_codon:yes stop_codon:yes gene_type:complete
MNQVNKKPVFNKTVISSLTLSNFRSYKFKRFEIDSNLVVLTGLNGAGKTNLLEALSFLVPGKGLRRAPLSEILHKSSQCKDKISNWAVAAKLKIGKNMMDVGTGCQFPDYDNNNQKNIKRVIKINGNMVKSQSELGEYVSAQWLTPQMDRLFAEGASGRRRFIDQITYALDPSHIGPVSAYEHSIRSRNKLLRNNCNNSEWLDSIEASISRHGVAVTVQRLQTVERLRKFCSIGNGIFPGSLIELNGQVERWLEKEPALAVEEKIRIELKASRESDSIIGHTSFGPHKSDLMVYHTKNKMEAKLCSTGEQKSLLISLVIAAVILQTQERGYAPFLLLDEITAHLDQDRRTSLFDLIVDLGVQAWITGTDPETFSSLKNSAQHFTIGAD